MTPASAGPQVVAVRATDRAGATATATATVNVSYAVCLLYDSTKAWRSGATIPIKLQLCDAAGANRSSATVGLQATQVRLVSTATSNAVQDAGQANPDGNFRFDATLGGIGGYIFNLKTTGLGTGTYELSLTAGSDPQTHVTPFQIR